MINIVSSLKDRFPFIQEVVFLKKKIQWWTDEKEKKYYILVVVILDINEYEKLFNNLELWEKQKKIISCFLINYHLIEAEFHVQFAA